MAYLFKQMTATLRTADALPSARSFLLHNRLSAVPVLLLSFSAVEAPILEEDLLGHLDSQVVHLGDRSLALEEVAFLHRVLDSDLRQVASLLREVHQPLLEEVDLEEEEEEIRNDGFHLRRSLQTRALVQLSNSGSGAWLPGLVSQQCRGATEGSLPHFLSADEHELLHRAYLSKYSINLGDCRCSCNGLKPIWARSYKIGPRRLRRNSFLIAVHVVHRHRNT